MTEGRYWGLGMATSGGVEVSETQMRHAFTAGGAENVLVTGDAEQVARWLEWYRLYWKAEAGAQRRAVAANLKRLAKRLDAALELIYETERPFPSDSEISGAWESPHQLATVLTNELQASHLTFGWRAREAFGPEQPFFETVRRSVEATTYLREVARTAGNRLARQGGKHGLNARDDFILSLIVLFEIRTGKRATMIVNNYGSGQIESRRSKAADFVRCLLRGLEKYLLGNLPDDLPDRARHLRAISQVSDRQAIAQIFRRVCGPGKIENLIDRFNRASTPAGQEAERRRLTLGEHLRRGS